MDLIKCILEGKKVKRMLEKQKNKKKIFQVDTKVVDHLELKIIPKVKKNVRI